jgi:hypothetical protein
MPAFAVSQPTNGLSVSPAVINLQVSPGQDTTTFNETVTNVTNASLAVNLSTKDFGALNANGSIGFYSPNSKNSSNPHSLASSIQLPNTEYLIYAHQAQTITITVNDISKLSPGGHYSALIFTPFTAISSPSKNQVSFQPSVASLIFLSTAGGGTQSIKLSGLSMPRFGFNLPTNIYVLLTNTGNTQVIPRGTITLKGPTSKLAAQTVINSSSGLILPGTSRLFTEALVTKNNLLKLAGFYNVQISYHVDGSSNYQYVTKSYFYLNPLTFVYMFLIVLIILVIKRMFKKSKQPHKTKTKFKKKKFS